MHTEDELMGILQRVWTKLQDLPQASSLEVGAFSVLILFAGEFAGFVCWTQIHHAMLK